MQNARGWRVALWVTPKMICPAIMQSMINLHCSRPNRRGDSNDVVDSETRSRMMAAVSQSDTKIEIRVRKILHRFGIRFRTKNRDLPGSPDIANRSAAWAIFVNGCFWHGHKNCRKTRSRKSSRVPKTRSEFWSSKLVANRSRDAKRCLELRKRGYRVLIVWECELFNMEKIEARLSAFVSEYKNTHR
jgi:DNA mismatch endonuclease, patch repair protein